jgi:serine/threonine protein kinase
MYLSISHQDITNGLKIIKDFVSQHNGSDLSEIEQAIIRGSLSKLTYQAMQQTESALQYYDVGYISRNLAFDLWNKLNTTITKSFLIQDDFKVSKKKLWHLINKLVDKVEGESLEFFDLPDDLEGKILLDRYEIEEHLFDRHSGERHFRAVDLHLGNKPCLLIQRRHQTAKIREQFQREAQVLSELGKHPQIPQLLAYFEDSQYLNLIYEYIPGKALTELLATQPWQETEAKLLLQNLLSVLEFIQSNNVVHRNLNPDTIIQSGSKWVVIDFATVKNLKYADHAISQSSIAQGIKGYMPAEQLIGMASFTSDIYAVGMIIIHALTGIHPRKLKINRQTGSVIWRNHVEVNNHFADILDRAICYHFGDRYQSATEILNDLAVV